MHKTAIEILVGYTFWADMRVLAACERLAAADFIRPVTPDPGWHSLRGTLVHALDTAYGWRAGLQEIEDSGIIDEAQFPDAASLKKRWAAEREAWLAYVSELTDEALNEIWFRHETSTRTRWQTILHVVNDLTHHRSEAAAMLTGFGQSPGELDFDQYVVDVLPGLGR